MHRIISYRSSAEVQEVLGNRNARRHAYTHAHMHTCGHAPFTVCTGGRGAVKPRRWQCQIGRCGGREVARGGHPELHHPMKGGGKEVSVEGGGEQAVRDCQHQQRPGATKLPRWQHEGTSSAVKSIIWEALVHKRAPNTDRRRQDELREDNRRGTARAPPPLNITNIPMTRGAHGRQGS